MQEGANLLIERLGARISKELPKCHAQPRIICRDCSCLAGAAAYMEQDGTRKGQEMSGAKATFNPLDVIASAYELSEKPELAREFKASGMKFSAVAYEAAGFGHVGVMNANGMFGLMKMETLVLNPFCVDAPLFSLDRVHAFGRAQGKAQRCRCL